MKKLAFLFLILSYSFNFNILFSQAGLTSPPSGGNKKASISEVIGITNVSIHYDRPGVKGREGQIWGKLVPEGFIDQGFGSSKAAPWRAGANENTTISFSTDVSINGQALKAGNYGFFIAYGTEESTLIFSNNSTSWGSFFYNSNEDALRVKIKPQHNDYLQEWLKFEFLNETDHSAMISLQWEKLKFEFTVEVDLNKTQLESFRRELKTDKGFQWETWNQAVEYCALHKVNLDEALLWADSATSNNFGGDKVFSTWANKSRILESLNRKDEADKMIKMALPFGNMFEIHHYGRQLIAQNKSKDAMEIFKFNLQKYPNEFTTKVGMVRGYSANGDFKAALKLAKEIVLIAPDPENKSSLENMIVKLSSNKDIN